MTDMTFEVLCLLMLNENLLIFKFAIAIPFEKWIKEIIGNLKKNFYTIIMYILNQICQMYKSNIINNRPERKYYMIYHKKIEVCNIKRID